MTAIKVYDLATNKTETKIVQPNKVTNVRHEFDEREENVLTLMIDALQKHMTKEKPIQRDLFNQPVISITCDTKQEKQKYLYSLSKMMKKAVSFDWKDEERDKIIGTKTVLISAFHNVHQTLKIDVTLSTWAIPYLIYYGKGVGGTIFSKRIALTLDGKYAKRIYKICKRWEDKGGFFMWLDEFRTMLNIPVSYNTSKIKTRILDASNEEMKKDADVYFNYSFTKEKGSKSFNAISFKIFSNPKNIGEKQKAVTTSVLEDKGEHYRFVYMIVSLAYPPIKNSIAMDVANKLSEEPEQLRKAYDRFKRMQKESKVLGRDMAENVPLIKYILDNDFDFNFMKKQ